MDDAADRKQQGASLSLQEGEDELQGGLINLEQLGRL